jgi:hypothetical protein
MSVRRKNNRRPETFLDGSTFSVEGQNRPEGLNLMMMMNRREGGWITSKLNSKFNTMNKIIRVLEIFIFYDTYY